MYTLILGIYLLTALCLIGIILMQKSAGIAIQAKNSFTGPRSRANVLTRITGILAIIFMGLCLLLTRMNIQEYKKTTALIAQEKEKVQEKK